jgi:soluble lytic murein transglycosylase-like protein
MTDQRLTRRAFVRRASGLVLATATGLVAAGARPQRAEAAGLCPTCGVAPRGPLHAHLYATSPDPVFADIVIGRESRWQSGAYNASSGASGLAQFIPSTFFWAQERFGIWGSPFDPYVSMDLMSALLREGEYYHWSETAPW